MEDSKRNHSESSSDDEQLEKNFEFLKIIKDKSVDGKKKKIDEALANGVNINFKDLNSHKKTALYYAVRNGEKEIVDHLLLKGAKMITEDKKANPLECAKKRKQKAISGSAEEKIYIKIIDALKHEISRNNPQPSTSQSQTSKTTAPILTDGDSVKSKQNHSASQEDVPSKKLKNNLLEDSKTHKVSKGPKSTLHGVVYQLKLLMLYAKRCQKAKYQFRLATEIDVADKFDDLFLEFINSDNDTKHVIFLQAKHIQKENEDKIKASDLLTKSEDKFSLQKYFRSYQNIKKNNKFKDQTKQYFIINTNIGFEFDKESQLLNTSLKKLNSLYFEDFDAVISKFDMKVDDGVKKSKFYKLVGSQHADKREKVVYELTSLFIKTTDFHKLAKELAKHLIGEISIDLRNSLFIEYRDFLAKEVIDIKTYKLRKEFIDLDSTLSSEAKDFKKVLLESLKNAMAKEDPSKKKRKLSIDDMPESCVWNKIDHYTLKISDGFKNKEENPTKIADGFFYDKEIKNDVEDFINHLIFAVNQPNEEKLGEIIDKEIGKEFNLINSELVTNDFAKRMLDWFKAKEGRYLKNEDVEAFFNESKEKISQLVLIGPTSVHIEKLKKTKIIFELNAIPVLLLDFLNQSNDKSPIEYKFCHLDTANTSPLLGSVKVSQALEEATQDYSSDDSFISLDLNTLLLIPDRVLNAFKKKKGAQLLIIECNSKEKFDEILNELKIHLDNSNQKRLLLIGPADNSLIEKFHYDYSESHLKIEDESHFKDLIKDSQNHLLNRKYKFQEYEVALNLLFEKTETNITNSIILPKFLDNENKFKIGTPIPIFYGYDKNYFIERTVWQKLEMDPNDLQKSDQISETSERNTAQESDKDESSKSDKTSNRMYLNDRYLLQKDLNDPNKPVKIKKTLKDLLEQLKQNTQNNVMIISDVAGMGKSTILSHLSHEIKKQNPHYWIVKIELSKYADALKDCTSFSRESAIDFISYKILKIQEPFEKELFKHLFGKKKVALLLDAFDEISPKYENAVFNLLEALNNTENQIWVTTRPHLKESLRKNLKGKMDFYNLEPFSQNDQIAFLTKFWTNQFGLQDEVKTKNYAEELLKTLTKSIRDNDFTGIPLQTRILAEAFEAEIKTFHIDENKNEPTFVNKLDILDLYDKFYKAKYDTVSQKGKVVEYETYKITNEYGIKHVYSDLALLMLFPEQESFLKIDKEDLLKLQIARFGIAEIINGKEIQFIHQTFAEYSVAEFFSTALTTNNPKEACNYFITNVLLDDKCQIIRYFIDCFLKKNFKKIAENHLKQYGEQIDKIWKDGTLKDDKKTILHVAAKEGNLETFKFLFKGLKDEYKDTLKSLLEARNNNQLAWHEAAKGGHDEVLEELWKWAKYFKLDPKTLLLEVGSDEETAWAQASKNHHFEILKKLWQWAQDIQQSFILKKNLLLSKDFFFKRNAFHYAVLNGNIKALETFQVWATEIQLDFKNDLLLCKDILVQTAFHLAAFKGHVKVLKILRDWATETFVDFQNDVLLSKCVEKRTIFHMAAWQGHAEVLLILRDWATKSNVDFKKKIMISKDNNKHTAFHLAVWEGHVEVLKILREWAKESDTGFKFGFLSKDEHQQTILHLAVEKGHVEVLKLLRDWTTEADANFMKSFLISKDINGNTAFHLAAWKGQVEVLKILREWAKETDADFKNDLLLSQNVNKQTIFHLAALEGHTEILKIVRDWATSTDADFKNHFMISKDKKKFTAFQLAAFNGHVKVLEILQDWAKETNCDFKNDLLLFKNDNEEIAFHMAAYNGHVEVLKILRNWGMETNCDIKTDFLLSKDKNGNNAFHLAAWKGHVEVLKQLQKWAPETKFDFENDLLFSVNYSKKTSLHLAAKNGHIEVLKILRDWAKKGKADFSKKIIISKAINGVTAFQLAVSAGHVEVLKILRDWATESECDFKNDFLLFKNNNGNTIFSIAACNGHVEVLKMFREWVAETDCDFKNDFLLSKNISGQTAFHLAAYAGKAEVLGTLRDWAKEAEADFMNDFVLSKDFQGKTAFNLAECQRHTEVMILLQFWETNSCILVWK